MLEKHVLFTNISYVTVGDGVRVHANAMLLSEAPHIFDGPPVRGVRLFGPDPAWETADLRVPSIGYDIFPARSRDFFIGGEGEEGPKPLFRGGVVKLHDGGPKLEIWADDSEHEIEIETFTGESTRDGAFIVNVWHVLAERALKHWHAPNAPVLQWLPVELARRQAKNRSDW